MTKENTFPPPRPSDNVSREYIELATQFNSANIGSAILFSAGCLATAFGAIKSFESGDSGDAVIYGGSSLLCAKVVVSRMRSYIRNRSDIASYEPSNN